jgi:transcriptional regulator with XRE-family HTH domain
MPRRRDEALLVKVGRRVAEVRRARGWTQERLAEALGVGPVTLSRLETGHRALSLSTLAGIAGALEVTLGDLLDVETRLPAPRREPGEQELLGLYRGLARADRDLLLRLAREVAR